MTTADRDFDDFRIGDGIRFQRRFSKRDFAAFSALSGDTNPLHKDPAYAAGTRFGAPIVPLHLVAAPLSAVAGTMLPGHRSLFVSTSLRALHPVAYDTELTYSARVLQIEPASRTLRIGAIVFSGNQVLLEAELVVQVRRDAPAGAWDAAAPATMNAFRERWMLVTGAGGHIGGAIALQLARGGWHLLLQHRKDSTHVAELAERCRAEGVQTRTLRADLERRKEQEELAAAAAGCCGVVHAASPVVDASAASLFAVNYEAFNLILAASLPEMLGRQHGRVVLVGSSALQYAGAGWEGYKAAKAAAVSLVGNINRRYGRYDISAATIAPGYVETPFSAKYRDPAVVGLSTLEVAERVVDILERKFGDADYVWLEPAFTRAGRYGFSSGIAAAAPLVEAARAAPAATEVVRPESGALSAVVREFLRLNQDYPLDDAGLDFTPGWDSLRHIELMLHLESSLGVRFTSADIEKTRRYSDLRALIHAKRAHP